MQTRRTWRAAEEAGKTHLEAAHRADAKETPLAHRRPPPSPAHAAPPLARNCGRPVRPRLLAAAPLRRRTSPGRAPAAPLATRHPGRPRTLC
jgi:hypothetical protein